jgi:hypothetical protein
LTSRVVYSQTLKILFIGTGCSFLGGLIIILTFATTKELHGKRALWHILLKATSVCTMAIGYWLNFFIPTSDCHDPTFCSVQFIFLQLGNTGIMLSEFAMTLEVFFLKRHFQRNTLALALSGPPLGIRLAYAVFGIWGVVSTATGLGMYHNPSKDYDAGLKCYLDAWCWYMDPWAVFAFKFAWIGGVVLFGIITIVDLMIVTMSLEKQASGSSAVSSSALKASQSLSGMLRNLLFGHIFAWGTTFAWRVGVSMNSPPTWATNPSSPVVLFVVFNGAGAGYYDCAVSCKHKRVLQW